MKNCDPIAWRIFLMKARLPGQNGLRDVIIEGVCCCTSVIPYPPSAICYLQSAARNPLPTILRRLQSFTSSQQSNLGADVKEVCSYKICAFITKIRLFSLFGSYICSIYRYYMILFSIFV
jgi:hypothetical protein